jgi:triosephosphate isomerase
MRKKSYIVIGNWKMYFTFNQTKTWLLNHKKELESTCKKSENSLIICPSFESLGLAQTDLANSSIALGAQDCSNHNSGAYTGQISAASLAEIGSHYCIIGHSERRLNQCETDEMVAKKCDLLWKNNIIPIICIGESLKEHKEGIAQAVIQKQLELITQLVKKQKITQKLLIAYEPIWSIGTGNIPPNNYLNEIFSSLFHFTKAWPNNAELKFLYGGSVNATNIQIFKPIEHLAGFLIGGASTDFQELKKIIELL